LPQFGEFLRIEVIRDRVKHETCDARLDCFGRGGKVSRLYLPVEKLLQLGSELDVHRCYLHFIR
jgi:hypothetical protein